MNKINTNKKFTDAKILFWIYFRHLCLLAASDIYTQYIDHYLKQNRLH